MAFHSLGGLRSLRTLVGPDRVIMRLSPIQTWLMEQVFAEHASSSQSLPPAKSMIRAAERLAARGLLVLNREKTVYRYRWLRETSSSGDENVTFHRSGVTRPKSSGNEINQGGRS